MDMCIYKVYTIKHKINIKELIIKHQQTTQHKNRYCSIEVNEPS